MAIRSSISLLMPAFLFASMAFAADAKFASILVRFNHNDGHGLLPVMYFFGRGSILKPTRTKTKTFLPFDLIQMVTVRRNTSFRTLCGNEGCEYPIFDGKTHAYLEIRQFYARAY
jgi:hypothetical protein